MGDWRLCRDLHALPWIRLRYRLLSMEQICENCGKTCLTDSDSLAYFDTGLCADCEKELNKIIYVDEKTTESSSF